MNSPENISLPSEPKAENRARVKLRLDQAFWRDGLPEQDGNGRPKHFSREARIKMFWDKVSVGHPSVCWPWMRCRNQDGYGRVNFGGVLHSSHRIAYFLTHKKDPESSLVLHSCDNPSCCNPAHLFLGTDQDNPDDKIRKGKGNHYQGENHPRATLSDDKVKEIKRIIVIFKNNLAKDFGIKPAQVDAIYARRQWKHIQWPDEMGDAIHL